MMRDLRECLCVNTTNKSITFVVIKRVRVNACMQIEADLVKQIKDCM